MTQQPIVLWISGSPGWGKSTLQTELASAAATVFSTDMFVRKIEEWCEDKRVLNLWQKHGGNSRIGAFLDQTVRHKRSSYIAGKILDPQCGFLQKSPLSIIEGYMPLAIQDKVMATLEVQGCFVWVAVRQEQLNYIRGFKNWR